jgi:hypothetical protein
MTMKKIYIPLFVLLLSTTLVAVTTESLDVKSIRQRAMGGVGVVTSRGDAALLRNPAILAYSRLKLTLPRIGVDINQGLLDNQSEIEDLMDTTLNDDERKELLLDLAPLEIAIKPRLYPGLSFITKGFGLGVFVESNIVAVLDKTSDDVNLSLEGHTDVVPAIGFAQEINFLNNKTAIGVSAKFISRYRIYDSSTGENEFTANLNDLIRILGDKDNKKEIETVEIKGLGLDLGFLRPIRSQRWGQGRWGVSVQNIGATLTGTKTVDDSDVDYEEIIGVTSTLGVGFKNRNIRNFFGDGGRFVGDTSYALDYTFVSEEEDFRKNLNVGIEQELFGPFLKLRGGVNDGYVSGGIGLDIYILKLPIIHLNYANYTEELGELTGQSPIQYQSLEVGILF